MKECRECGGMFSEDNFSIAKTDKNGKIYHRNVCKQCYSSRSSNRISVRGKWFKDYKKELKCSKCGIEDYRVLEFHHFNDDKSGNISEMVGKGYAVDTVIKEIEKCIVLCANCHRIVHYELRENE